MTFQDDSRSYASSCQFNTTMVALCLDHRSSLLAVDCKIDKVTSPSCPSFPPSAKARISCPPLFTRSSSVHLHSSSSYISSGRFPPRLVAIVHLPSFFPHFSHQHRQAVMGLMLLGNSTSVIKNSTFFNCSDGAFYSLGEASLQVSR
eukprot:760348-Hanusia_phi.AAC.17